MARHTRLYKLFWEEYKANNLYNFSVTFIGLQVLGSISLLSGNDSPVVSELKSSENKNVGANVDNHVTLKKLKNDKVNNVFGKGNLKYLYLHNKYFN